MTALLIILGAGIGAPSRFLVDQYLRRYIKYPYGILIVNVLGSFVIGLTVAHPNSSSAYLSAGSIDSVHAFFAVGFAGAFTTWSTFILDIYLAIELRRYKSAFINLALSIVLGILAVGVGMNLAP